MKNLQFYKNQLISQIIPMKKLYKTIIFYVFFFSAFCSYGSAFNIPHNNIARQRGVLQYDPAESLKITVKEKGIYSVTYSDIKAAGWDPESLDPTGLMLKTQGFDVHLLFSGDGDKSFDPGDYFIFYGEPVESDMTQSSKNKFVLSNVYWLYASGDNAERMQEQSVSPSEAETLHDFREVVRIEKDLIMRGGNIDSYFWESFPDYEDVDRDDPAEKSFIVNLSGVNTDKVALLRVRLKGDNDNPDIDPDHHASVAVNNSFTGNAYFEAWGTYLYEDQIPPHILSEGNNTIIVKNMLDLSPEEDMIRLDWIEVEYSRQFIATNSELVFSIDNETEYNITIAGFDDSSVMLFDITDPNRTVQLIDFKISQNSSGYSITFGDHSDTEKTFIAITSSHLKTPDLIEPYKDSGLLKTTNQADYVMITHEDFYDEIQRLADYRKKDGYEVKVVKVQDIYDEFNYGIMHPQAIKDFIDFAYHNWAPPALTFLLLIGDGNSDATDRLNTGNKNYIPIKYHYFSSGGSAGPNDTWYVQVSGDDVIADCVIGRIPVKTSKQLELIIDRIINYEKGEKEEWMRKALLVAGDNPYFVAGNEQLAEDKFPFNYKIDFYNRDEESDPSVITDRINSGRAFTIYSGHGNITTWNGVLKTSDLDKLDPSAKPTFLITLNCLNGHFSNPSNESMAEEFLRRDGGAIACFSPSGYGYTFEHLEITKNFLDLLFVEKETVLGTIAMQAKLYAYLDGVISEGTYEQYLFFGDPATKFKICEFYLSSPADRATISQKTAFSWVGDGFTRFLLQFSTSPEFAKGETFPAFASDDIYIPNAFSWKILNSMANRYNVIFWRVGGMDKTFRIRDLLGEVSKSVPFTEPMSFTINQVSLNN